MHLHPLTLDDKSIFDSYAAINRNNLSSYAFAPIYVWSHHFQYFWTLINDHFCVFAKQAQDYFMPILPMGEPFCYEVANSAFHYCLETNKNRQIARIENVPEVLLQDFQQEGYRCVQQETEYIYRAADLVQLNGNRYKSKRNVYNTFIESHLSVKLTPYHNSDLEECLELYDCWQKSRSEQNDDEVYLAMLEDSKSAHTVGITHAEELGLMGRVVRLDGEIKAYTFGYPLNSEMFCVLFEIADLNINGLSQFIYREFCRELMPRYKWINAMDDSGLENLKRVKRSYHPTNMMPSYTVYENRTNIP